MKILILSFLDRRAVFDWIWDVIRAIRELAFAT